MSQVRANKEVYNLIRDGVPVDYENHEGRREQTRVRVIDFDNPGKNDFWAVTQLWIKGERYFRRPDVLLYVNGIPLVFIELKNSNIALKTPMTITSSIIVKTFPFSFSTTPCASSPTPLKPKSAA